MYPSTLNPRALRELIAARASLRENKDNIVRAEREGRESVDKYGKPIWLNQKQSEFVDLVTSSPRPAGEGSSTGSRSAILVGAAGTGKTTCMREVVRELTLRPDFPIIQDEHKHLIPGTPGIVICAYTRRAVANIRRSLPENLASNCITIHKLLEYAPVYYEVVDPATGESKTTMKFEPSRHRHNPLPPSIRTIIYEESSMIGTDLYKEVQAALAHPVQEIFLGDIQQLRPIFGPAILGFKMEELSMIELTEVYRQALESPIIRLLHRIISGRVIPPTEFPEWSFPGQLTIHPWKKKISPDAALLTSAAFFVKAEETGRYNPDEDIILCPFNKSFGTIELNKRIANHLARKRGAITHEVIAGFMKHYFSVGDKVLYEKEDAVITNIYPNPAYSGAAFRPASTHLSYHGVYLEGHRGPSSGEEISEDDVDFFLSQAAAKEDRVHQSSHIIVMEMVGDSSREPIKIDSAKDVNALLLGYALSVHKAQGSEWNRVFLVFHQSHATMTQREMLYTAISRAREEVYIICEPETFVNGINSQGIKGNTLAEKAEYFKGKYISSGKSGEE